MLLAWKSHHVWGDGNSQYLALCRTVATNRMWLLSPWNVTSATKELNFKFYVVFINLNLNNHSPCSDCFSHKWGICSFCLLHRLETREPHGYTKLFKDRNWKYAMTLSIFWYPCLFFHSKAGGYHFWRVLSVMLFLLFSWRCFLSIRINLELIV